jgi:Mce-associated membrane protein
VLLALLIAGIVAAGIFLIQVRRADAAASRRQAAVAAARQAVADLTTADYQHPQQYVDRLRAVATGKFLGLFANSATGFKGVLIQGKVQTTGRVAEVGVQRAGADTAQLSVLAYVTVKNSQTPNGARRAYRLSVSMISAGSRWLVSDVEFVK